MAAKIQTWGVGGRDYSDNISLSTIPVVTSHQFRYVGVGQYFLPTGIYVITVDWDVMFALEGITGGQLIQIYDLICTTDENEVVGAGLADDYPFTMTGAGENMICYKLGYREAKITISKGHKFDLRGVLNPAVSGTYSGWPMFIFANYAGHPINLIFAFQAMGSSYA